MQLLLYRIGDSTKIRFLINVRFRVIYSTVLPKGIPQRQKWMIHMEEIMQMILGTQNSSSDRWFRPLLYWKLSTPADRKRHS